MKRSLPTILAPVACLLLTFVLVPEGGARAAGPDLTPKWQQTFPDSIHWYVRTSLGILLVRSGKSLIAVDGVDGKQLWSLPEIQIGEGLEGKGPFDARGHDLLEVPGYSILLINRARLNNSKAVTGELLGIDLWTGQVLWRQAEIEDLLTVIPFYDSGRILVVTRKFDRTRWILESLPYAGIVASLAFGDVTPPFRAEMHLIDPLTGKADWSAEYPQVFGTLIFDVQAFDGRLFLHESNGHGNIIVGAVDLKTGAKAWEFEGGVELDRAALPVLQSAAGRVVIGGKGVTAIESGSGAQAWRVSDVGSVSGLLTDGDTIFGTGSKKTFALDAKTGTPRWESSGHDGVTTPLFYKETNLLVFCNNSKLVVLDASTGKLVRQEPLFLSAQPLLVYKIGNKFLAAFTDSEAGVYDIQTAKRIAFEGETKGAFPAISFLMRQYMRGVGSLPPPPDLHQDLENAWPTIIENAKKGENGQTVIERLEPFLKEDFSDSSAYATESSDVWRLWHINPETGVTEAVEFKGSKPDVSLEFGLGYFVQGKTLEAVPWSSSYKTYEFVAAPR